MAERQRRAKGEGSLYRLADGRWRGSVDLGWHGGKQRRKHVTRKTKAEVGRELRRLLAEADAGRLSPECSPTVEEWMATYLREVAADRVRPSTRHSYEQFARLYINPWLGKHRLDKLRPQHVAAFYRQMGTTLAPSSVRRIHAVLRRALTVAARWGLIPTNPTLLVDPPSMSRTAIKPYTVHEARTFLEAAGHDRLEARWVIALTLGLRQGEVLGLGWQHVDFANRVLHVERALQRQPDGSLALVRTKTDRSNRIIPMPASVLGALARRREPSNPNAGWPGTHGPRATWCSPPASARQSTPETTTARSRTSPRRQGCPESDCTISGTRPPACCWRKRFRRGSSWRSSGTPRSA